MNHFWRKALKKFGLGKTKVAVINISMPNLANNNARNNVKS